MMISFDDVILFDIFAIFYTLYPAEPMIFVKTPQYFLNYYSLSIPKLKHNE